MHYSLSTHFNVFLLIHCINEWLLIFPLWIILYLLYMVLTGTTLYIPSGARGAVTMISPRWGCWDVAPSDAEFFTPSVAEGVVFMYQISRLGFARRTVCGAEELLLEYRPRGVKCFLPRAKPRGGSRAKPRWWCLCIRFLVSASLDEQFSCGGECSQCGVEELTPPYGHPSTRGE